MISLPTCFFFFVHKQLKTVSYIFKNCLGVVRVKTFNEMNYIPIKSVTEWTLLILHKYPHLKHSAYTSPFERYTSINPLTISSAYIFGMLLACTINTWATSLVIQATKMQYIIIRMNTSSNTVLFKVPTCVCWISKRKENISGSVDTMTAGQSHI